VLYHFRSVADFVGLIEGYFSANVVQTFIAQINSARCFKMVAPKLFLSFVTLHFYFFNALGLFVLLRLGLRVLLTTLCLKNHDFFNFSAILLFRSIGLQLCLSFESYQLTYTTIFSVLLPWSFVRVVGRNDWFFEQNKVFIGSPIFGDEEEVKKSQSQNKQQENEQY